MNTPENDKRWDFSRWADRCDAVVACDAQRYYAAYENVLDAVVAMANVSYDLRI